MNSKMRRRMRVLLRRANYLAQRIQKGESNNSFDIQEYKALVWALDTLGKVFIAPNNETQGEGA